ncbi:hypothetical protein TKK_0015905 [Trichogramma kaykai]|uniref:Ubiquitin-like-conjugating enzyme ATG10 n=1 Tax=Trichogramma kaykai TaxID=54128 RepID=A0ABD2WA49_9HYME
MDGPGTVTWEEFVKNAEDMIKVSARISDGWEFLGEMDVPGEAYLKRVEKHMLPSNHSIFLDDTSLENEDEVEKDPFEFDTGGNEKLRPLIIEHNILWSESYGVPVIYFNGWKSDYVNCNRVSCEEAQQFSCDEADRLGYGELSQAIHPIRKQPYLWLHPCASSKLIQNTSNSSNKLVSWLSSIAARALGLRVKPEYYQLTLNDNIATNASLRHV